MQNELTILESLINKNLLSPGDSSIQDEHKVFFSLIQAEQEKIKQNIAFSSFRLKKKPLKHYVRHHQAKLVSLHDALYDSIKIKSDLFPEKYFSDIKHAVINVIDDLLYFLEQHLPEYFNYNSEIPRKKREDAVNEFKRKLAEIGKNKIFEENQVLSVILVPVRDYINKPRMVQTFNSTSYSRLLFAEIISAEGTPATISLDMMLISRMYYMNFNYLPFFYHLVNSIKSELEKVELMADRILKLSWHLKTINQTAVKTGVAYNKEQKPLKELMSSWIIAELCFIEQDIHITQTGINDGQKSISKNMLPFDLSVEQLACLIRIMTDTGVFKTNTVIETIKFFASFSQTRRRDKISSEKLRIKFYDIDQSTLQVINSILLKMVNKVNDMM